MPEMEPTMREPYGVSIISALVPTATPPASVAFWMCTCRTNRPALAPQGDGNCPGTVQMAKWENRL